MSNVIDADRAREDIKNKGIRVKWEDQFAREWDEIICVKDVISKEGEKIKWRVFSLTEIVVEPPETSEHWMLKRIRISWFWDELFHPKKFRLNK